MQDYLSWNGSYYRNLSLVAMHRFGGFNVIDTETLSIYLLFLTFLCHFVSSKWILSKLASFLGHLEGHLKIQPQLINRNLAKYINLGLLVWQEGYLSSNLLDQNISILHLSTRKIRKDMHMSAFHWCWVVCVHQCTVTHVAMVDLELNWIWGLWSEGLDFFC